MGGGINWDHLPDGTIVADSVGVELRLLGLPGDFRVTATTSGSVMKVKNWIWNGDPDAGGTAVMEWVPVTGVSGGDVFEWAPAGWSPQNNVSTAAPAGTLEQVDFNRPIAGWGVDEVPGVGTNYRFSRSIVNVNEERSISIAVAFLTIMDAIGDPFDIILFEGIASEGFFGGTALNSVRIDGPEGLADVSFDIPLSIVNLIGFEDAKQYELKVIDSQGRLDLIERGVIRCTSSGLSFTATPVPM